MKFSEREIKLIIRFLCKYLNKHQYDNRTKNKYYFSHKPDLLTRASEAASISACCMLCPDPVASRVPRKYTATMYFRVLVGPMDSITLENYYQINNIQNFANNRYRICHTRDIQNLVIPTGSEKLRGSLRFFTKKGSILIHLLMFIDQQ